ncbi:MAG: M48 family metallopeptidase [Atopobiaceae bacterium]
MISSAHKVASGRSPRDTYDYVLDIGGVRVVVVRSRVRNANLRVRPDGSVRMSVPLGTTRAQAERVARSHATWIARSSAAALRASQSEAPWLDGRQVYVWGIPRTLRLLRGTTSRPPKATLRDTEVVVQTGSADDDQPTPDQLRDLVLDLMADLVRDEAHRLLPRLESQVGVSAGALSVRLMRTRWGSCTPATRRIRLSSTLASYSPGCLRAVLTHELCHILQANHGPAFWALMDAHCPDWRDCRAELRSRRPLADPRTCGTRQPS